MSQVSRQVSRKQNADRCSCREVSRKNSSDMIKEARSIHQLSRSYRGSRNFLDRSTSCQDSYRDYDEKQLKILTERPGVEEVSRLLKNSFSRREKHKYECNQACNSTNDPINILNSQKHLLTTIFKHMDPKTHTY